MYEWDAKNKYVKLFQHTTLIHSMMTRNMSEAYSIWG